MLPRTRVRTCVRTCVGITVEWAVVEAIFSSCGEERRKEGNRYQSSLLSLIEFLNLPRPVDKSRWRLRPPRGDATSLLPSREVGTFVECGGGKYMGLFSVYGNVRRMVLHSIEGKEFCNSNFGSRWRRGSFVYLVKHVTF